MLEEESLVELYKDTDIPEYRDIFYTQSNNKAEFVQKYLVSKLWRLNNIYTIVDKDAKKVKFVMNRSQHIVYASSLQTNRLIILKSRQQGISTLWLVSFFDDCLFKSNFTSGLMAQGLKESKKLFERVEILWDNLDNDIKRFLRLVKTKDNMEQTTLSNGSNLFIRSSFRSATLQRLHVSELGKIAKANPERAKEFKTGTLEAIGKNNKVIIESTAEGENMFKEMWDTASTVSLKYRTKIDLSPIFLSWLHDPDCQLDICQEMTPKGLQYFKKLEHMGLKVTQNQKNFWLAKYRSLGEDIYQEYPAYPEEAFLSRMEGSFYNPQYVESIVRRNREVKDLFNPDLDLQIAVDIGKNDLFVLLYFQTFTDGWRIVESYHNSHKGIGHYCQHIKETQKKYNNCPISRVILPHDARVTELTSDIDREASFNKYGINNTYVAARTKDIRNDIEIVRQSIEFMAIDPDKASYIKECFLNYSRNGIK